MDNIVSQESVLKAHEAVKVQRELRKELKERLIEEISSLYPGATESSTFNENCKMTLNLIEEREKSNILDIFSSHLNQLDFAPNNFSFYPEMVILDGKGNIEYDYLQVSYS